MSKFLVRLKTRYLDNLKSSSFDDNRPRIDEENRSGIVVILVFTLLIILANLLTQPFMGNDVTPQLVQLGFYTVMALVAYTFALRKPGARHTLWIYLVELPMLILSMLSGTVLSSHEMLTFTFMFVLLVFPPLILDKPKHIIAFILILAILFALLDFPSKDAAVFSRDMLHLFNACLISITATLYYAATRMENIRYASYFAEKSVRDPLTGLYNRAGAEQNIDASRPGALVYIDLDNFKEINDTFGHSEGDRVLEKTARVLRGSFRDDDVIIRLGGDEFAVFVRGSWSEMAIERRLKQVLSALGQIEVSSDASDGERPTPILASVGCAIAPRGCESLDQMIRLADEEMYQAKEAGKNDYRIVEVG